MTDLIVEMLGVLASYSITVRELRSLFAFLKAKEGQWVSIVTLFLEYIFWGYDSLVMCSVNYTSPHTNVLLKNGVKRGRY